MRIKSITLAMLIGSVTSVLGQVVPPVSPETPLLPPIPQKDVDSAMQRIEQRQADREARGEAPATQPTQGAGTIPDDPQLMRQEILRLRREVSALRQRNSDILSQLVAVQPDRSDLRQLQDELRLESEREQLEDRRDDLASERGRDGYDRDQRFNDTPFGGGYNNRDVIVVQPDRRPGDPVPNPADPTPPTPPSEDPPRARPPQGPVDQGDRVQPMPRNQGSQQGGARPGNGGSGKANDGGGNANDAGGNANDGGGQTKQGGAVRPGGAAR